jgi:plasmid stabilization system protein ParE
MPDDLGVRWTVPARNDLVNAHAYLQELNPAAAAKFARNVRALVNSIPEFPRRGARLRDIPLEGEYRSLVSGYYRLVYRPDLDAVYIMRIWDCRQDPDRMWEDLES